MFLSMLMLLYNPWRHFMSKYFIAAGKFLSCFFSPEGIWMKMKTHRQIFSYFFLVVSEKRKCLTFTLHIFHILFRCVVNIKRIQPSSLLATHWHFIPLLAKRVGECIKIRHKRISPTRILSTLGCLSLCDSEANNW